MINKFLVFPCVKQSNENGYNGPVVTLACASNISFVLFFPVSEENAKLINYILDHKPSEYNSNLDIIGIYKTMIDSWEAGGRYLAGISLDTEFNANSKEEIIDVMLVLSDDDGAIDSIIKVNFIHAVLLAAMERKEILVSSDLLKKLLPHMVKESDLEEDEDLKKDTIKNNKKIPVDEDILNLAKKIMSGKIK